MKYFLLFILYLSTTHCKSQPLFHFKESADSIIKTYFALSARQNINCEGFEFRTYCHDISWMELSCNANEDPNKFDNEGCKFILVGVEYSIYSSELKDKIFFTISVDSNKRNNFNIFLSQIIPDCIREDDYCNFISKDSALKIANSMLTGKNLFRTSFIKNKLDKQYYWETIWIQNEKNYGTSILRINAISGKSIESKYFETY